MTWFAFAILAAVSESLKDVSSKHSLIHLDEEVVAWIGMICSSLFLLPLLWLEGFPTLEHPFWPALLLCGGLNVLATLLYVKALKHSDLSITTPIIAFTPLFMLITSPLMIQEWPGLADAIGIGLIVCGSYILNFRERQRGYWAPFQALLSQPGPRYMAGVAFLWSLTSNLDKIGVQSSSPLGWSVAIYGAIALGLTPIALRRSPQPLQAALPHWKLLATVGLCNALTLAFQMSAIQQTLVAQVIAVKRTSTLMSVFLGYWLFQEKNIGERLAGAVLMVLGVAVISLF